MTSCSIERHLEFAQGDLSVDDDSMTELLWHWIFRASLRMIVIWPPQRQAGKVDRANFTVI
jgi:hypothetical protein